MNASCLQIGGDFIEERVIFFGVRKRGVLIMGFDVRQERLIEVLQSRCQMLGVKPTGVMEFIGDLLPQNLHLPDLHYSIEISGPNLLCFGNGGKINFIRICYNTF